MKKLLIVPVLMLLLGCSQVCTPELIADETGATTEGINSLVNANNQFAMDFYDKINQRDDGNIFFSPYSLSTALGMTYEGAKEQTASEIQNVFYFPDNDTLRRGSTGAIYNQLNNKCADYMLSTANALWIQQDFRILDDYVNIVKDHYVGEATNLDFVQEPEQSRQTINGWVEDQTNDKIKDLIPPGILGPLTRLVITNAIYFKGNWLHQFDEADTINDSFNTGNGTVQAPMMRLTDNELEFNYTEDNEAQVLEMIYEGEDLSMIVLLPKENNTLDSINLTLDKLNGWKSSLNERIVHIFMPKFTFETKYFLADELSEMGMPTAFTDDADFSGISDIPLMIDDVIHQAFVQVNEEGTEAAAATAVIIKESSMPMITTFRADHPFIFIIQERSTGAILFMGRVVNPAE